MISSFRSLLAGTLAGAMAAGCGSSGLPPAATPSRTATAPPPTPGDTAQWALVPPGHGTLRQDEIAIKIGVRNAVQARVLPLDESVIRLLAPDSYRALRDLQAGRREEIAAIARRYNLRQPALFYVSFYGLEPEARFSPRELVVTSSGRDVRPVEIIPLTMGFGEQRIRQRETQSAIYVFEDGIDVLQPMTVTLEGTANRSWEATLRVLERERALVRSRAGGEGGAA
ncbi:MAG: hypothetical protein M3373_00690 [Gemmatimonadota bacterium]|nr:hypothetical protein [Gemmatimonadota bacterium]